MTANPFEKDLLELSLMEILELIKNKDDICQTILHHSNRDATLSATSLRSTQASIHTQLGLALLAATALTYSASGTGLGLGLALPASAVGLSAVYNRSVIRNDHSLHSSLEDVKNVSLKMEQQLLEAHQRTDLLREYEKLQRERQELEQEQGRHQKEKEDWVAKMREARENHDAAVQRILDQAIQADELLSSMKRNYEEAESVTRRETGWTSIFSAAKAFIAYLARWLS
jgi:hypothetical protein